VDIVLNPTGVPRDERAESAETHLGWQRVAAPLESAFANPGFDGTREKRYSWLSQGGEASEHGKKRASR